VTELAKVDPEVAAGTFEAHLDDFFANGRGRGEAWERLPVDALHAVIRLPAVRADGSVDPYFLLLGAEYYPVWPASVAFVRRTADGSWVEAADGTRWWPRQQNQPGFSFGLHPTYQYPDGTVRQLVCFSHSLDYYVSNHNPTDDERWDQRRHTLTATLSRMADVLRAPNYQEPSGDRDS
jgi:hypothetical protein